MPKKTQPGDTKGIYRREIFKYILEHDITSRTDIARDLNISMPTTLQYINELMERGLIRDSGQFKSTGGRKATALTCSDSAAYTLGVDITKNHISYVIINLCEEIVEKERDLVPYGNDSIYYKTLEDGSRRFLKKSGIDESKIVGVGISFPGTLNADGSVITDSYVLNLKNVPSQMITNNFNWDSCCINDANAAGYAEMRKRKIKNDFVYLSLSNSVGGAVFIDGKPFYGSSQRSGEFGHMRIIPGGKRCYCGQRGCLDAYCSALVLSPTGEHLENFFNKLNAGDKDAEKTWDDYLDHLAIAVIDLRMNFDVEIILGGYVGKFMGPWMHKLWPKVTQLDAFEVNSMSYLHPCVCELEASAYGASILALEKYIERL